MMVTPDQKRKDTASAFSTQGEEAEKVLLRASQSRRSEVAFISLKSLKDYKYRFSDTRGWPDQRYDKALSLDAEFDSSKYKSNFLDEVHCKNFVQRLALDVAGAEREGFLLPPTFMRVISGIKATVENVLNGYDDPTIIFDHNLLHTNFVSKRWAYKNDPRGNWNVGKDDTAEYIKARLLFNFSTSDGKGKTVRGFFDIVDMEPDIVVGQPMMGRDFSELYPDIFRSAVEAYNADSRSSGELPAEH
jgi:hypothetical protein